ncbi:leucine-rich repeat domain-containing protein [Emticicia sp. C21]|uniref:leucine-rich repeat domain-containing protein n=1 Tax=Emticicia sp. C21 TaxID=2302915 RepID=UPI0018F28610|nr:leucine-rich repeat domain-containing protein [Emticicia sp. C21]
MNNRIIRIDNDVQDRNSVAWKKLCEYIDKIAEEESDEFSPAEALGKDSFAQIYTLPESIAKLKKVKKVWLYGSNLKRIPPEIGEMESLEYFDPYTSYNLFWFPYEITNCKRLKDSRVSTRVLYGNYKNRKGFPSLSHNPIRYSGDSLKCSVCKREITYKETNQLWISLWIGTDVLPLLANLCSIECEMKLPQPPNEYVPYAHKGGADLKQPPDENEFLKKAIESGGPKYIHGEIIKIDETSIKTQELTLLKLVRKIWDK